MAQPLVMKRAVEQMTFYKPGADGCQVKEKSVVGKCIVMDPFKRTRETGTEFLRASLAGRLVRNSLRGLLQHATDSSMISRLTRVLMQVIQSDKTNERGMRHVSNGNTSILKGFEFNRNAPLNTTLMAPYTAIIDHATGVVFMEVSTFNPAYRSVHPEGTTHYQLTAAGVAIDFEADSYVPDIKTTGIKPLEARQATFNPVCRLPANSRHTLVAVLGIEFFRDVQGTKFPVNYTGSYAAAILEVSGEYPVISSTYPPTRSAL